jgi:hypothetical protein
VSSARGATRTRARRNTGVEGHASSTSTQRC